MEKKFTEEDLEIAFYYGVYAAGKNSPDIVKFVNDFKHSEYERPEFQLDHCVYFYLLSLQNAKKEKK